MKNNVVARYLTKQITSSRYETAHSVRTEAGSAGIRNQLLKWPSEQESDHIQTGLCNMRSPCRNLLCESVFNVL